MGRFSVMTLTDAAAQRVGRPDAANTVARDFLALAGIHVAAVEAMASDAATGSAASAASKSSPSNGKPNGMHLVSQGVS